MNYHGGETIAYIYHNNITVLLVADIQGKNKHIILFSY